MKTIMALSLGLLLSAGAAATALGADTSVTGHLRDSFCFLTMGADGASHQKCAIGCAQKGIPVLVVEDKTEKYYVLLPPKDAQPLPAGLINQMEDEVTVSGTEDSKGVMTLLTGNSVP